MDCDKEKYQLWLRRRAQRDGATTRNGQGEKLRDKSINIIRRLTVLFFSIVYKKYRNAPLPTLETTKRILIIPNFPIGDLLLTSTVWQTLKKKNPQLVIGVVVSNENKAFALKDDSINERYNLFSGTIISRWKELLRARRDGWDVVLAYAGFYKPTRFAVVSRLIARNGFTATLHSSRYWRYARIYSYCTKRPADPFPQPKVEQMQSLAERVFNFTFTADERMPQLTERQVTAPDTDLRIDNILTQTKTNKIIVINLEAKNPRREWGIDNSTELALRIVEQSPDVIILLTASPCYWQEYGNRLQQFTSDRVQVFPTFSIEDLCALIRRAALVISPDTAVVHIAAALGRRIVAFYPSTDEWIPYSSEATVMYAGPLMAISTISVDKVFNTVSTDLSSN